MESEDVKSEVINGAALRIPAQQLPARWLMSSLTRKCALSKDISAMGSASGLCGHHRHHHRSSF
jgi:hypothetical protein